MLTPAMLRILRWLDEHPATLESAWDVPRSISLEGVADGVGVVRSALFQPMSELEESGLIHTRQAHVLGSGRGKGKSATSPRTVEGCSQNMQKTHPNLAQSTLKI